MKCEKCRMACPSVVVSTIFEETVPEEAPGVTSVGFGVWYGPGDHRNQALLSGGRVQTNNRAEVSAFTWVCSVAAECRGAL